MNRDIKLYVAGGWVTADNLKTGAMPGQYTAQEEKVISLCRDWLEGKAHFEFHTSGSTGTPKSIVFSSSQLEASARLSEKVLNLRAGQTALIALDTAFIAGAMMVIRSLVVGMNMIVKTPSSDPLEGVQEQIDFAALVPYQASTVLRENPVKLNKIKTIIIGGAPLSNKTRLQLQDHPGDIYLTYGMTETITHVALQKLSGTNPQDYFTLLPGILAKTSHEGCLMLNVPHVSPEWIVTNDVVSMIESDKFLWLGRLDRVINSGGIKIQPEKVEDAVERTFLELGLDRRFFVCGLPDPDFGERVVLIIEGKNAIDPVQLKAKLSQQLPHMEVPKDILFSDRFIETDTQKVDRPGTIRALRT